jgi:hypothetical protein
MEASSQDQIGWPSRLTSPGRTDLTMSAEDLELQARIMDAFEKDDTKFDEYEYVEFGVCEHFQLTMNAPNPNPVPRVRGLAKYPGVFKG